MRMAGLMLAGRKLLDEMVKVWRPISAVHLGGNTYEIENQEIPDYEIWEFQPGDIVETKMRGGRLCHHQFLRDIRF